MAEVQFCPYEDVLGIGHSSGFSSIVSIADPLLCIKFVMVLLSFLTFVFSWCPEQESPTTIRLRQTHLTHESNGERLQ